MASVVDQMTAIKGVKIGVASRLLAVKRPDLFLSVNNGSNPQLAKLIGETDFSTLFHQGERESMYLADVARRVILVVLFDNRTTLGLVRLKLKHVVEELTGLVQAVFARPRHGEEPATNPFAGADDEIDRLFQ